MMNSEEILTYLILIAIGYFIVKMFSRCTNGENGFRVGSQGDGEPETFGSGYSFVCTNTNKPPQAGVPCPHLREVADAPFFLSCDDIINRSEKPSLCQTGYKTGDEADKDKNKFCCETTWIPTKSNTCHKITDTYCKPKTVTCSDGTLCNEGEKCLCTYIPPAGTTCTCIDSSS